MTLAFYLLEQGIRTWNTGELPLLSEPHFHRRAFEDVRHRCQLWFAPVIFEYFQICSTRLQEMSISLAISFDGPPCFWVHQGYSVRSWRSHWSPDTAWHCRAGYWPQAQAAYWWAVHGSWHPDDSAGCQRKRKSCLAASCHLRTLYLDNIGRAEGGLLHLGEEVIRVAIQNHFAHWHQGKLILRPGFGGVQRVKGLVQLLGDVHHLDVQLVLDELASSYGLP